MSHAPAHAALDEPVEREFDPQINDQADLEDAPPQLDHRRRTMAFGVIALGMFLSTLDSTIVSTALPTIVGDLGGAEHLTWVVTAYLLTSTIASALAGKFGDLFGRKRIYLGAVVLFVAASALCGAAQSMGWLIGARALQGIGGGAMMVTATAIIADIIPLEDRGRYQGSLGAVFGLSTVLGPLFGGLFTDHLSWRWVFYVNVPIAPFVLWGAWKLLPLTRGKVKPVIDTLGITAISISAGAIILATSLGGTQYAWSSATIIGLFVVGAVFMVLFVLAERRAKSPLLPLRLFKGNVFSVSSILSFLVGFALMGCMTFMPTYLQYCLGVSATISGVRMLPMVIGLMGASVFSGNVVSKKGIYKPFPIVGAVVMACGMYLLSTMDEHSGFWHVSAAMFVIGVGLGLAMQVLTIIVQATADYKDLGVATSGVTFFRSLGQSFGTAVFGTIYSNLLAPRLVTAIKQAIAVSHDPKVASAVSTPAGVHALPEAVRAPILAAYANTIQHMFLYAIPVAAVALGAALFMKAVPLKQANAKSASDMGAAFGAPDQRSSAEQLESRLAWNFKQVAEDWYDEISVDNSRQISRAWVVRSVAVAQHRAGGFVKPSELARRHRIPLGLIELALDNAAEAGLVQLAPEGVVLTAAGFQVFREVISSTMKQLTSMVESENGAPLDDQDRRELAQVARRVVLDGTTSHAPRRALAA